VQNAKTSAAEAAWNKKLRSPGIRGPGGGAVIECGGSGEPLHGSASQKLQAALYFRGAFGWKAPRQHTPSCTSQTLELNAPLYKNIYFLNCSFYLFIYWFYFLFLFRDADNPLEATRMGGEIYFFSQMDLY